MLQVHDDPEVLLDAMFARRQQPEKQWIGPEDL
jgi:hypothetical protein